MVFAGEKNRFMVMPVSLYFSYIFDEPHMSLCYHTRNIASLSVQGVHLKKATGAYELFIGLDLQMQTSSEDEVYYLRVEAARLFVKGANGIERYIGILRPTELNMLRTWDYSHRQCLEMTLMLQPGQVAAIEDIRGGGDLTFKFEVRGQAYLNGDEQRAHDNFTVRVPKSEWLNRLKSARFMDVLLLEVPFSAIDLPEQLRVIRDDLEQAQNLFMNADYANCVAQCRHAIQELGHYVYDDQKWAEGALKKLNDEARAMGKEEREKAIFAAIRHYVHQAHHSSGEGGVRHYDRSEARMILQMTAAAVGAVANQ